MTVAKHAGWLVACIRTYFTGYNFRLFTGMKHNFYCKSHGKPCNSHRIRIASDTKSRGRNRDILFSFFLYMQWRGKQCFRRKLAWHIRKQMVAKLECLACRCRRKSNAQIELMDITNEFCFKNQIYACLQNYKKGTF